MLEFPVYSNYNSLEILKATKYMFGQNIILVLTFLDYN